MPLKAQGLHILYAVGPMVRRSKPLRSLENGHSSLTPPRRRHQDINSFPRPCGHLCSISTQQTVAFNVKYFLLAALSYHDRPPCAADPCLPVRPVRRNEIDHPNHHHPPAHRRALSSAQHQSSRVLSLSHYYYSIIIANSCARSTASPLALYNQLHNTSPIVNTTCS